MRILKSLVAVTAIAATTSALAMAPALADPVNSHLHNVTPKAYDIVGVGSNTIQFLLDQLSVNYNAAHKTHNASHPYIYSWDATPPGQPNNLTSTIRPKSGCTKILRPDGSSAGIQALPAATRTGSYRCLNFARSSRPRGATDPTKGPGGVAFVALAKDAVTYSTAKNTNAPASLTAKQLGEIYSCTVPATGGHPANNWADLGGKSGTINPVLPQASSGTRSFFLASIGVASPGNCVNTRLPEENEGVAKVFKTDSANIVFPFSVGSYIEQADHSAACGKKPAKTQNSFGCDQVGKLVLKEISHTHPTTGTGKKTVINSHFPQLFQRVLYDVVPFASGTKGNIPSRLQRFFAPATGHGTHGWFCAKAQQSVIKDYGFLPTPICGLTS